jgi:hypothetical protein
MMVPKFLADTSVLSFFVLLFPAGGGDFSRESPQVADMQRSGRKRSGKR